MKTVLTNVFINGQDVGLDNKQEQLYRKYMARPYAVPVVERPRPE